MKYYMPIQVALGAVVFVAGFTAHIELCLLGVIAMGAVGYIHGQKVGT